MYQCTNCGGQLFFDIPSQNLKCMQCSSLFDPYEITKEKDAEEEQFYDVTVFKCPQCGGEIISSDNRASDFCSFCGASTVLTSNMRKEKRPQYIIPFSKTKEDCKKAYSKYMKHAWFAPHELKDPKHIDGFRGIYMPYWAYHITETGPVSFSGSHSYRRGNYIHTDYYALTGEINSSYKGISYDASSSFDDSISESLAPYEVKNMNRFTPSYLSGFYADTADVAPAIYEHKAKEIASSETLKYVKSSAVISHKHFTFDESDTSVMRKLNPQCKRVDGAMFPVWFLSYRNKDRVAYATVNGQTGKVVADMPVSISRYLLSSIILAIPVFLILNAMLNLLPTTTMSLSSLIASLVPFLFNHELKQIIVKDNIPYKIKKKEKRKKTSMSFLIPFAIVLFSYLFSGLFFLGALWLESTHGIFTYLALIIGTTGFLCSIKPYRAVTEKKMPVTVFSFIALLASCAIETLYPVSDIPYYAGSIINLAAVLTVLVSLIKYYNVLATRRLPQFDTHKGGDDRA